MSKPGRKLGATDQEISDLLACGFGVRAICRTLHVTPSRVVKLNPNKSMPFSPEENAKIHAILLAVVKNPHIFGKIRAMAREILGAWP